MSRIVFAFVMALAMIQTGCGKKSSPELFGAVNRGDVAAAEKLLETGASPNSTSGEGKTTAINASISNGDVPMASLLLKYKASPEADDPQGFNPLHWVASTGMDTGRQILFIRILTGAGADLNKKNFGKTLLHTLSNGAPGNPQVIREAIRLGADPTIKNEQGATAIDMAVEKNIDTPTIEYMKDYKKHVGQPAPKSGNTEGCKVLKMGKEFNSEGIAGIYSSTFKNGCVNGQADGISGALTFADGRVCNGSWRNGTAIDVRCTIKRSGVGSSQARILDSSLPPTRPPENIEEHPKGETVWLGHRIVMMAGDDHKRTPSPMAARETLTECKFSGDDPAYYRAKSCEIHDVAPGRQRTSEQLSIFPRTARCCLFALKISQIQSDFDGGLHLFDLPDLTKSRISCPTLEEGSTAGNGTEFWLVSKAGAPRFVIREDTSSGSGGSSTDTTIFFGTTAAKCNEFKLAEEDIGAHQKVVYLESKPKQVATKHHVPSKSVTSPQQRGAPSNSSSSYSNSVACVAPHVSGMAAQMATILMQVAADSPMAFGSVITNSTYAKYCQIAYGTPGAENIQMAKLIRKNGDISYWVADRGVAAVGFIKRH